MKYSKPYMIDPKITPMTKIRKCPATFPIVKGFGADVKPELEPEVHSFSFGKYSLPHA